MRGPNQPAASCLPIFLEPFFPALDIGGIEILIRFHQVNDAFDQTDQPHDERADLDQGAEDCYEEHDQPLLRIAQIEFMDPQPSQKNSQHARDHSVLAAQSRAAFAQNEAAFDAHDLIRLSGVSAVMTEFLLHQRRHSALWTSDRFVVYLLAAVPAVHEASFRD